MHKYSLYVMEIIIFQLLYCLYRYDSSIGVPVCIRKQDRYTGLQPGAFRTVLRYTGFYPVALITVHPVYRIPVALIYRFSSIPASGVQRVKCVSVVSSYCFSVNLYYQLRICTSKVRAVLYSVCSMMSLQSVWLNCQWSSCSKRVTVLEL